MKNKTLIFLVTTIFVMVLMFNVSVVNAAESLQVIESPDIKIIIDGNLGEYSAVPLILNNSTLLPLREVLVNLGVTNDNEHIIWNGAESSVTIKKDNKIVYLKINSTIALVDGVETILTAPPILYKDKTYVPARFLAQCFGKKVIWDGQARSVLITEEIMFNRIQTLEQKMQEAEKIDKYSQKMSVEMDLFIEENPFLSINMNMNSNIDVPNKLMYSKSESNFLFESLTETYIINNKQYSKADGGDWIVSDVIFEKELESNANDFGKTFESSDIFYAGMVVTEETDEYITISGDITGTDALNGAAIPDISESFPTVMHMVIQISKENYRISFIKVFFEVSETDPEMNMEISAICKIEITCDYDPDFVIVLPDELKKIEKIN